MTRINVGIRPIELPNKLLIAEHREITRIPNAVKSGRAIVKNIPPRFTLGTGHVKFFYDKLGYLARRYQSLYLECITRHFAVTNKLDSFNFLPANLFQDYTETEEDRAMLISRIHSKGFVLRGEIVESSITV
jgi:hypothetical protein